VSLLDLLGEMANGGAMSGNPEALRASARDLESDARRAEEAIEQIRFARTTVLAGWEAASAEGFTTLSSDRRRPWRAGSTPATPPRGSSRPTPTTSSAPSSRPRRTASQPRGS